MPLQSLSIGENLYLAEMLRELYLMTGTVGVSGPIFDRVDNTNPRQWDQLIDLPGKGLQSAEINEIQSLINYYLRLHIEALNSPGDVIFGCQLTSTGKSVSITSGRLFIADKIREVQGTLAPIPIGGVGTETIGLKATVLELTEIDDPSMLDPAESWAFFSQPGMHRRFVKLVWV